MPPQIHEPQPTPESNESFGDILKQYEQGRSKKSPEGGAQAAGGQLEGTVGCHHGENAVLDIGYKTEGILPLAQAGGETVQSGRQVQGLGEGPQRRRAITSSRA